MYFFNRAPGVAFLFLPLLTPFYFITMCFLILADLLARSGTAGGAAQEVVSLWYACVDLNNWYFLGG